MKKMSIFSFCVIYFVFSFLQCKRQSTSISNESVIVSINGGGFYGGLNPTTLSKTMIYSNGKIILTNGSLYGDTTETIFFISHNEIKELEDIIIKNGFWGMSNLYDCSNSDTKCQNKKTSYPSPIPLIFEANINNQSKTVKVSIMDREFVEYPVGLDTILVRIDKLVNKAKRENQ